ncbi:MAG: TIGR02281 family clan AA aspartic protease [Alphaproteobacteria bacterium]|nr:TIGR02281 family clan AA aspartic protease [Alphaproteobacteria bacterium]MBV9586439.1 TIGR02281 family clan AA aspartic protease [Alphaproteobacteria bacterium]MBV9966328.1 TIGR02281 family clan AA aspartic protease [Alphaproteobacteria bacterium]
MIGWAFRQVLIWGGLAVIIYMVAGQRELWMPRSDEPVAAAVATPAPQPQAQTTVGNSVTYNADKRGQFWIDAVVNGASVHFVVDTGATALTLTAADAAAAGIGHGNLTYNVIMNTANGQGQAAQVQLREVRIGQLTIDNVPALVTDNLHVSLLGMSFLKRLQRFEIGDGTLTIYWD